jgi:DNA-binding transcriptional LysR family regulator
MELRHLRYLVAIAEAGAFVRAAERLRVAQPALTRQMHDLEKELGAPLFDPGARKATLTAAGKACERLARHILQDTEKAVARARLSNSGVIGRCVIATGPLPLAVGLVSGFLGRMRANFPGISVVVLERAGPAQWAAIERAEVDIGLGIEPSAAPPALSMALQYLHKVDRIAVGPDHPLAQRESVTLADLLTSPLLHLESGYATAIDRVIATLEPAMRAQGIDPDKLERHSCSSIETLLAHVRAGQGWAPVPATMGPVLSGVVLLKVDGFHATLPTVRIWRRAESRPVVLTVLDQLKGFKEDKGGDSASRRPSMDFQPEVVPPRLELRHLRSFLAVVEHGSLGRAAEIVGVTQPALSRQMRELEYDVGVALFSRESRGMEITPAGETFRDDIDDVLAVVDKIPREIRRAERGEAQRCLIAVVPHPAVDATVARALADLEGRGERVRIGTRSIMSIHQAEALHVGEVDISLTYVFPVPKAGPAPGHFTTVPLCDDRLSVALLSPDHPLADRPTLQVAELAATPFAWMRRDFYPEFYDVVLATLAAAGLTPRCEGEYEGVTTMWSLVRQGAGWTLGWRSHLREAPPGLKAVPLSDFDLPWGIAMSYRQDEARVPVLATVDALLAHTGDWACVKAPEAALRADRTAGVVIA